MYLQVLDLLDIDELLVIPPENALKHLGDHHFERRNTVDVVQLHNQISIAALLTKLLGLHLNKNEQIFEGEGDLLLNLGQQLWSLDLLGDFIKKANMVDD
jgi:hypothetical protein